MQGLRVRQNASEGGHGGEVFSCVYSNDGAFVLSAGWDGCLRLWQSDQAQLVSYLHASLKPLSACAFAPGGASWVCGSMDGELSWWDAVSHLRERYVVAHIRPISAIQFSPDGRYFVTASWDRKLLLRRVGDEQEDQALAGHRDIVAGCRWSADSKQLLSWSHDTKLRLWDADSASNIAVLDGHTDRVTAACMSHDGQWAVSGSRDGAVKLWDLRRYAEARSFQLTDEVRGCWYLGDGASVLTVLADGWIGVWSLPDWEIQTELTSNIQPLCCDLSPTGAELVLGSETGRLHFVAIDGAEETPLPVTATPLFKPKSGVITRFLGKRKSEQAYQYTCPACGHAGEIASLPREAVPCSFCNRLLRLNAEVQQLQPQ
ncbi:MAG TPA: WD40 repeat domain-containing protein [Gemmataceae bacterium]|nr:WD40 repeat domain-containing protein [Gemmataceae bacterium]